MYNKVHILWLLQSLNLIFSKLWKLQIEPLCSKGSICRLFLSQRSSFKSCKNLPVYLVSFYFSNSFCTCVHERKCYVNSINLDETLAFYFHRPHGGFRIVNEMIKHQWIFCYKDQYSTDILNQYASSCSAYIDWYNTHIKIGCGQFLPKRYNRKIATIASIYISIGSHVLSEC